MEHDFENALAFGTLLRENDTAGKLYDAYSPEQKQAVILRLSTVETGGMEDFVGSLSAPLGKQPLE